MELRQIKTNTSKSILAAILYLVLSVIMVAFLRGGYEYLTLKFLGGSIIIVDALVFGLIVLFTFIIARFCAGIFKIENIQLYGRLTMVFGFILMLAYLWGEVAGATAFYLEELGANIISKLDAYLEHYALNFDYISDTVIEDINQDIAISLARRGRSAAFALPSFINYIVLIIMTGIFSIPKSEVKFNNIRVNGNSVEPVKYYFITNEILTTNQLIEAIENKDPKVSRVEQDFLISIVGRRIKMYDITVYPKIDNLESAVAITSISEQLDSKTKIRSLNFPKTTTNVLLTESDINAILDSTPLFGGFIKEIIEEETARDEKVQEVIDKQH